MLRIDLSTLSRTELKHLLAAAEGRGQDALVEQLKAALAARASAEAARPRPLEAFEDDEPAPMAALDDDVPGLRLDRDARRSPSARGWPAGLAIAAVLLVGGATSWGLNGAPGLPGGAVAPAAPAATAAPALRAMTARVEAAPAPAASPAPLPAPALDPAAPPQPRLKPAPRPEPAATLAKAEAPPPTPRRLDPCATPPTPADRLLCQDLALNLLDHEMREAYGRAMDAGADAAALQAGQAAWRRARDPVADPRALAALYDRRIRDLKAMAGEARPDAAAATVDRQ